MKRLILLIVLAIVFLLGQSLMNCSRPLDRSEDDFNIPDSIFIIDTIFESDTIVSIDTIVVMDTIIRIDTVLTIDTIITVDTIFDNDTIILFDTIIDTVNHIDTLVIVDTVIVVHTDTLMVPTTFCARLAAARKEVVWMYDNPPGEFQLKFLATVDRDDPPQVLMVNIDGFEYTWQLDLTLELVIEQDLDANSTVKISSGSPHSFGHPIDICLIVTP